MLNFNQFGQPLGTPVPNWRGCPEPTDVVLTGRTCRIERYNKAKHADDLWAAFSQSDGNDWTYRSVGPFATADEYRAYAEICEKSPDPRHYTVIDLSTGKPTGTMSLMRIDPKNGVIEVGHIAFSPLLRRSTLSTEAQYLLMSYVFEGLGYRRYEWKCNTLNEPSRQAALRLGFTFEGIFRNLYVCKGYNWDLAWHSITAEEWPQQRAAFQAWLAPENFDDQGRQIRKLAELRKK